MSKINLKIKRISSLAKMPTYATEGAAGMDLYAANEKPITLMPLERHPASGFITNSYLEVDSLSRDR